MAKWEVQVKETRYTTLMVEADSWTKARQEAERQYATGAAPPEEVRVSADPLHQLGEPWVRGPDPFYFKKGCAEGVLVFERAYGFTFSQEDLNILINRCRNFGLKVVDHWNGLGVRSFSIQCEDLSPVNDAVIAGLIAPRGE